jgi:hypothetical protein
VTLLIALSTVAIKKAVQKRLHLVDLGEVPALNVLSN